MSNKGSFILFTEQRAVMDKLSDEQAGRLIKAIYEYAETGVMPELDEMLDLVITPFKLSIDRNNSKWQETKQKRSEAGKLGAEAKKQKQAKQANANFVKQSQANEANAESDKQSQANQAVSVSDSVSVSVSVNDSVSVNKIKKEKRKRKDFIPPTLEAIEQYAKEKQLNVDTRKFYDYFTESKWIDKNGAEVSNWKLKLITWSKYPEKKNLPKEIPKVENEGLKAVDISQLTAEEYEMLMKGKVTIEELIKRGRANV